jgi:hypothetical protein
MAVPSINIVIEKSTDFSTIFKLRKDGAPIDLTGCTFLSRMRKHYSSDVFYEFIVTPSVPLTGGIINISMFREDTELIPEGRYLYDILITFNNVTTKVIEGTVLVKGTSSK